MTLSQAPAGSSAGVRGTAYARMPAAQKIAADPQIVAAVVARNLVPESADQIRRRDADWKANPRAMPQQPAVGLRRRSARSAYNG